MTGATSSYRNCGEESAGKAGWNTDNGGPEVVPRAILVLASSVEEPDANHPVAIVLIQGEDEEVDRDKIIYLRVVKTADILDAGPIIQRIT